ncbi:alpha/beta fold hydrolase [Variovorax sp. dw_308]|uniref:alpha/beta fold hydrolase n=1 Tax=Variovorax sp. dw_308 TaxID=2721546 RepID=UPI001C43AA5B|nr:alpha/beta hydrolase [Variovorax sp. dw_308]
MPADLSPLPLPEGVRSRFADNGNGLQMHWLEAGFEQPGQPLVVLLHGFPELAFSWRHQMLPLAALGFHVIAPDQRGYGRTTGWDARYDEGDLASFRMLNLVRDVLGLVFTLGHRQVAAVVGHDFGSPVAAWCALLRPDVFRSVVLMSAPFAGPPALPFDTVGHPTPARASMADVLAALAALPRPRKHYQWYYSTPEANADMHGAIQGVHDLLRAYYHHKSAEWPGNQPHPLPGLDADALATLPTYYVMDMALDMAATVAAEMPSPEAISACRWLPDEALRVYSAEYARNGFQGGLQWYRCGTSARFAAELQTFAGKTIDVPACFIAGRQDWGVHQVPGAFEAMQRRACTDLRAVHLVNGAGHWVQQEQPEAVNQRLGEFLAQLRR